MNKKIKFMIIGISLSLFFINPYIFMEILFPTPNNEKIHTIVSGDTLANISFKYYTDEDRENGAHWIHIYEYSVMKGYINAELQPILPYSKGEGAFVKIFIDKTVAIPYFKNEYPSAKELLKLRGYSMDNDGNIKSANDDEDISKIDVDVKVEIVDDITKIIGLPISIGIEEKKEEQYENNENEMPKEIKIEIEVEEDIENN